MTSPRHLALDNAVARWAHWPHKTTSPYYPKFYGALQPHGVVPVATMGNKVGWLATEQADVLHFHWPDSFWRRDFGRYLGRVKGIWNAREYLRTAKRAGLKIVWTVHNHDAHEGGDWLDVMGYRILAARGRPDYLSHALECRRGCSNLSPARHHRRHVARQYGGNLSGTPASSDRRRRARFGPGAPNCQLSRLPAPLQGAGAGVSSCAAPSRERSNCSSQVHRAADTICGPYAMRRPLCRMSFCSIDGQRIRSLPTSPPRATPCCCRTPRSRRVAHCWRRGHSAAV